MRVIYITFDLYPENSGQSIYSAAMARSLSNYVDLYVYAYIGKNIDTDNADFSNYKNIKFYQYCERKNLKSIICKMAVLNNIDADMVKDIQQCIVEKRIDYVVIDHIGMSSYYFYLKRRFPNIKFIYLSHNAESLNIKASLLSGTRTKLFWRTRVFIHKKVEKRILETVDKIVSISKDDTEFFVNHLKIKTPIFQAHPRYTFSDIWDKNNIDEFKKCIIIVGSMNWYPNVSGTVKFVEDCFSELIKHNCEYKLYIVGKNPTKQIQRLAQKYDQVIVTGFVEDIDEYYKKCDVAIIPVYEGTGLKIKLIEAAGKGIPIITTRFAAKGYDITNEVLFADNKDEFMRAINKLEHNRDFRQEKHLGSLSLYNDITCDVDFWNKIFC